MGKASRSLRTRQARRHPHGNRRISIGALGVVVGLAAAIVAVQASRPHGQGMHHDVATQTLTGPAGPEGVPLEVGTPLASANSAATGEAVNGIQCGASEQTAYHIHTHLTVFVDGQLRPLPPGIGIVTPVAQQTPDGPFYGATTCYYWLHVHAQDGIIHIESPTTRTYTLGEFFAIWGQPLSNSRIGPITGSLTVFVDGRAYTRDPHNIDLGSHEDIQIDVGTPTVAPEAVDWSTSEL